MTPVRWKTISTPGQRAHGVRERVDLLARVDGQADSDQRLERAAERREVDLGVEAADDAALAQRPQPRQRRGGRDPDALGEALVGDPGVRGEQLEDARGRRRRAVAVDHSARARSAVGWPKNIHV